MEHLYFRAFTLTVTLFGIAVVYVAGVRARKAEAARLANMIATDKPQSEQQRTAPWARGTHVALGLAAFYLLFFRLISLAPPFVWQQDGGPILMSLSFLFLGPFIAGFITVSKSNKEAAWPFRFWILAPWIPIGLNILLAISFAWEGTICVIFILPPALFSSSLGGIAAGVFHERSQKRIKNRTLYCAAALPLLLAVVETYVHQPLQTRTVDTSIIIHAPVATVWKNIERVPAISPSELRRSWANTIGFPRPVEATLSHEGVGGVRNASFERGLNFTETITEWVPNERIVFTIQADTSAIPSTTLDEHVTVGGRFFDVLTGEYDLHPLPNGEVMLHLSSRERLSTDFNAYAALWSDAVMHDMQSNILHVIRNRCESKSSEANVGFPTRPSTR
ncbi:SRPBCC domain-containing protein [Granulicella cerasi]|uniref:SRPBCC domain-containing protein n=1 Tax=Granulicella cerasi TaxID=741063 RepID=A0ABW1Z9B6_9BACT|nr:SRPBCC family protein [Granulicella cerasi]